MTVQSCIKVIQLFARNYILVSEMMNIFSEMMNIFSLSFTEADFSHPSHGADVFCGVGLALGLLGVAAGTFLFVKGHHG